MATDDVMLNTLLDYRSMATDQSKHQFMLRDRTMIQFLAYSLDSADTKIVVTALETFQHLMENESDNRILRSVFGVLEALKCTCERSDLPEEATVLAYQLYKSLSSDRPIFPACSKLKDTQNVDSKGFTKLSTAVITLHIHKLSADTKQELQSALVKIKGVVSVVIDVEHQRCYIRTLPHITAVDIAEVIATMTTMEAKLVVRNQFNQEILKTIRKEEQGDDDSLPLYLPDEESPVKDKAVSKFNDFRTNATGWIQAATSYFQNAFYW